MKNGLISGLVGGIVFFLLGGLFYAYLFSEFFSSHIPEGMEIVYKEPDLAYIFAADILLGLFLGFVFDKWANIRSFSKGATLGFILVLAFSIHFNLIFSGTTNMVDLATGCADICISAVMGAIGGGIIGLILGKLNKSTE